MRANLTEAMLKKLKDKRYRNAFVGSRVRNWIAYQIRTIREQRRWSQVEFAKKIGKPQSVISRLEDPNYGKVTVQTLLEVATAFNAALVIKFVDFSTFIRETADTSSKGMQVEEFDADSIASQGDPFDVKTPTFGTPGYYQAQLAESGANSDKLIEMDSGLGGQYVQ